MQNIENLDQINQIFEEYLGTLKPKEQEVLLTQIKQMDDTQKVELAQAMYQKLMENKAQTDSANGPQSYNLDPQQDYNVPEQLTGYMDGGYHNENDGGLADFLNIDDINQIEDAYKGVQEIKAIQRSLKDGGYKPGKIDGVYGDKTKKSIESYMKDGGYKSLKKAFNGAYKKQTKRNLSNTAFNFLNL